MSLRELTEEAIFGSAIRNYKSLWFRFRSAPGLAWPLSVQAGSHLVAQVGSGLSSPDRPTDGRKNGGRSARKAARGEFRGLNPTVGLHLGACGGLGGRFLMSEVPLYGWISVGDVCVRVREREAEREGGGERGREGGEGGLSDLSPSLPLSLRIANDPLEFFNSKWGKGFPCRWSRGLSCHETPRMASRTHLFRSSKR